MEKAWQPLPGSEPVSIVDFDGKGCRWPVGDKPVMFCNCPADHLGGNQYCDEHMKLSYPSRVTSRGNYKVRVRNW